MKKIIPLTELNQIKKGTGLFLTGRHYKDRYIKISEIKVTPSVLVGADMVEVILDKRANTYFNFEMFIKGGSWVKEIGVVTDVIKEVHKSVIKLPDRVEDTESINVYLEHYASGMYECKIDQMLRSPSGLIEVSFKPKNQEERIQCIDCISAIEEKKVKFILTKYIFKAW